MVTVSSPSLATRASSLRARAGMMALIGRGTGVESSAWRTERRKPSAACMVIWLPCAASSTPVSTGRASSVEAAKTTCWIISFKSATLIWMPSARSAPAWAGIPGRRCT